jgi:hypothetical protein
MMKKLETSRQIRVFEEEMDIIRRAAAKEGGSIQVTLSRIIKEWELIQYVRAHEQRTTKGN